jgi:YD repeat-containing protein
MAMAKILLFFIAFLGGFSPCYSQYAGDILPVNPVTPNEAAMFKPVAQPIGNFSGIVPTEIPLFTAGKPSMPIPITLTYNASGFKVEELASSTGLGWNLSVGGSITRVMHGLPDDQPTSGFFTNTITKPSTVLGLSNYWDLEPILNDVRIGGLDLQPDEFYYTCNGISGKFFFDETGHIHLNEPNGVSITPVWQVQGQSGNFIMGWVLRDVKGNKYYFGLNHTGSGTSVSDNNSVTYSSNNGYTNLPGSYPYVADWHLVEIDDMNGNDLADFTYAATENYMETRLQAYMKLQTGPTIGCEHGETYNSDETFATLQTFEHVLTGITTPADQITIYGNYNRIDYGGLQVDSIRQTDHWGNLKKMVHFNYDYFHQSYIPTGQDAYYKRLMLKNISEWGTNRADSLTHSFDYYTTYNLPSRLSRGQDYWGYYNGQDGNWTLLPNGSYTAMGVTVSEGTLGERRPIFPYSEANMLTKIHFPTGGTRTFTYEANQYLWDPTSTAVPDASYYVYRSLYASTWTTSPPTAPQYQTTFTINSQTGGAVWNFYLDGCCFYGSYSVKLLNQPGTTTLMTWSNQLSGNMSLQNGTYQVQFFFDIYNNTFYDFNAYWTELSMNTATMTRFGRILKKDNMTGPGVRIKQVDDYDPVSKQTITTKYQYNLFSDSTLTSGLLITPVNVLIDMSCQSCDYVRLCANSNYPLIQQGGNFVNYTDVRTYQTGNGKTDQRYSFDFDNSQGGNYNEWLSAPQDNSWRRSKLLSERVYDNSGTLLRMDTTAYSTVGNNSSWFINAYIYPDSSASPNFTYWQTLGFKVHAWPDGVNPGTLDYCYEPYCLTSQFMAPDSSISYLYTPNGTQVEKTAYTYYGNLQYPVIKEEKRSLNNNTYSLSDYRYSFNAVADFLLPMSPTDTTIMHILLTRNFLRPIETTTRKLQGTTTSFVEGMHYGFGTFNGSSYYTNLARHYTTLSDYTDMNYIAYDSMGNLTEESKTGDVHTVWIWGYNHTLPVAKVIGSTYTTANGYLTYNNVQNPSSDAVLRTEIAKIRSGLASGPQQVLTFSWSPLFGMTSQVDPAGTVTYYEYDNHGRLLNIRDQNNNIVKRFTYTLNNP